MLSFNKSILSLLLIMGIVTPFVGQQREKVLLARTFKTSDRPMPYRLYVPENYSSSKKYPLVLYLHGGGGRGDDNLRQIEGGNGFLIDLLIKRESQS